MVPLLRTPRGQRHIMAAQPQTAGVTSLAHCIRLVDLLLPSHNDHREELVECGSGWCGAGQCSEATADVQAQGGGGAQRGGFPDAAVQAATRPHFRSVCVCVYVRATMRLCGPLRVGWICPPWCPRRSVSCCRTALGNLVGLAGTGRLCASRVAHICSHLSLQEDAEKKYEWNSIRLDRILVDYLLREVCGKRICESAQAA